MSSGTKRSKTISPEVRVVSRVLPTPFVNSKGFRIGDYHVLVNKDSLPFNGIDQANYYLYNLFDYASYQGMPKGEEERDVKSFFPHKQSEVKVFTPIRYPDLEQQKILQMEQSLLKEENKRLRQNMRTLQNKLAEITGDVGDPELRKKLRKLLEKEISEETTTFTTKEDKEKKTQQILSESLNAIGELEDNVESFRPLFPKARGGKTKRFNKLKKIKRRNKTNKNNKSIKKT